MKTCGLCKSNKSLDNFSNQKKAPWKLYAWCDECRLNFKDVKLPAIKPKVVYLREVQEMRNKTRQLRKFNDAQVADIKERKAKGDTNKEIADDYGVGPDSIGRALRYRS